MFFSAQILQEVWVEEGKILETAPEPKQLHFPGIAYTGMYL